jgi:hypothetical protein
MRIPNLALVAALLVGTAGWAASAQVTHAAAAQTKVVIVVGATQGVTSSYRADADVIGAQFAQYTSNIVKVYSPYATWSAVAAATQGANILVYLGHGSGYPNPYGVGYEQPNADNGMGLNASYGNGDSNTQYYGENYMALLGLAPNAVVFLNHLCYASGDSEPGRGLPTFSVAQQRVDGYASGFLRGGAKAVIAQGMSSLADYITGLFTSHSTIDAIWKASGNFHNHLTSWASTRSPGFTTQIDPDLDHPQSDGDYYYSSMVAIPTLATDQVISGQIAPFVSQTGTYYPVPPTRVVDTRGNGVGPLGRIASGGTYTYQITGATVPKDAIAITANVTVTNQTSYGYVFVGPSIVGMPGSSTINFPFGDNRANGVTVPLSATGTLDAWYTGGAIDSTTDLVIDVTGYFLANAKGDGYVQFGPQRILDTRDGTGLKGKFTSGQPRQIHVAGVDGLPATGIAAIAGNVTAVNASYKGFVYVGPTASSSPTSSTINFPAGDIRANNFIVPVNADGTVSAVFYTSPGSGDVDLVLDISGYFLAGSGAAYHTLSPTRVMDSRIGNGLQGPIPAASPQVLKVSAHSGVPTTALAITANLTVTGQTSGGYSAIGPSVGASPAFSNLNFPVSDVRANGVIVPLGGGGAEELVYGAPGGQTAQLILDVSGYFQ